jgi:hypothetical protein
MGSQPIQPPLQSTGGRPVQQLNPYQAMPNRAYIWRSDVRFFWSST